VSKTEKDNGMNVQSVKKAPDLFCETPAKWLAFCRKSVWYGFIKKIFMIFSYYKIFWETIEKINGENLLILKCKNDTNKARGESEWNCRDKSNGIWKSTATRL